MKSKLNEIKAQEALQESLLADIKIEAVEFLYSRIDDSELVDEFQYSLRCSRMQAIIMKDSCIKRDF